MATNRGVVYVGPGKVEVRNIEFPKLVDPRGRRADHGVILKVVSTNICGSDQHMVRGRTTAPPGLVLGHEITGEVIEAGRDVQFIEVGDLVSPFNGVWTLPYVQGARDGCVPKRESGARRRRVRLRRHGWMDRRPGGICDGPIRGLQPAAVP